jgi:hypothetical protein
MILFNRWESLFSNQMILNLIEMGPITVDYARMAIVHGKLLLQIVKGERHNYVGHVNIIR